MKVDRLSAYLALGLADWRSLRRDPLLPWIAAVPLLLALLLRWGVPPLERFLAERLDFHLSPYHPLLMSFFLLTAPLMMGMVVGFLLLDERDEGIFPALLTTPFPLGDYLAYRMLAPLILGFAATIGFYPLASLAPLSLPCLAAIAAVAALNGPLAALFLASLAENKVTGFAMVKILNTLNMLPVLAYFWRSPWQVLAGMIPAYWPMKALWAAHGGASPWPYVLAGMVVGMGACRLLLVRFRRIIYH